jgi:hypothetical protein|nr:MAG TPA: hypothetical protein [Caudoviricetes sp.]
MLFMREFLAETALNLYFNLQKGSSEMMAMLYASKICMEAINTKTKKPWEFADVPPKLKQQVADILINECGLPELVPAEFGGTAKAE